MDVSVQKRPEIMTLGLRISETSEGGFLKFRRCTELGDHPYNEVADVVTAGGTAVVKRCKLCVRNRGDATRVYPSTITGVIGFTLLETCQMCRN